MTFKDLNCQKGSGEHWGTPLPDLSINPLTEGKRFSTGGSSGPLPMTAFIDVEGEFERKAEGPGYC